MRWTLPAALLLALGGCDPGTVEEAGTTRPSVTQCRSLCTNWATSFYDACIADTPTDATCEPTRDARLASCDDIEEDDCTQEVEDLFAERPAEACAFSEVASSYCDGEVMVGTCENGRVTRKTCDDTACGGAEPVSLGCRLDADGDAFCDCACDENAPTTCSSDSTVSYCDYSTLQSYECTDQNCFDSGYGRSQGCGEQTDGKMGCVCDRLCTADDNYCDGNTLYFCNNVILEPTPCTLALCTDAGFVGLLGCGTNVMGVQSCTCY